MSKYNRFFRREFLAKPDDESRSTAVIARVSNHSLEEGNGWLSAHITFQEIAEVIEAYGSGAFALHFYADKADEMKSVMRQVDVLKKIVNDFADAVSAEIEALSKQEPNNK